MDNIDEELKALLRQAYIDFISGTKSLREISEETKIDRKRIKKLMEIILTPEELEKFNKVLNKRNNKTKVGKRGKKERAIQGDKYKDAIEKLAKMGVTPTYIEDIYNRCQQKKQTMISRDTLALKLVELLKYFKGRNLGIDEANPGYISIEDVKEMILRNPKMMTSGIESSIIPKCVVITEKNDNNVKVANMKIKSNPGIFRKTIKNIREGK